MSKIQPGSGYGFTSGGYGFSLNTENPFAPEPPEEKYHQFQCVVVKENDNFFLKTYKGVVNYSKSPFPMKPGGGGFPVGEITPFYWTERQARITDWAVYMDGDRTPGTATDGPRFNWMANDGKIQIYNADYEGGSNQWLVTISMVDWNAEETAVPRRLINAGMPFVSVFPLGDPEMTPRIQAATVSSQSKQFEYISILPGGGLYPSNGSYIPLRVGYTYKKIAQLDWDSTTNSWQVSQYAFGPIDLRIGFFSINDTEPSLPPDPSEFQQALASGFTYMDNYPWFESMWSIPGYTQNPDNWWFHLVNA